MRATVLALAATRAATDCPMSVTVDGTAYTYDLDDQWRSVRWDLFAARTMVAALPAIAGEGCTERACTVDKVAEAMVRRRAECDHANAVVHAAIAAFPRVAVHVTKSLRILAYFD